MSTGEGGTSTPAGLLQPLPIPEWKWEVISLDFITGLPLTKKKHDSIMVVVDKLSKLVHFILVKSTYKAINVAEIFLKEVFQRHGVPKMVIFDEDVKFTSKFWKSLFAEYQSAIVEIEGTISNQIISILIDSGTTLSYISPRVIEYL